MSSPSTTVLHFFLAFASTAAMHSAAAAAQADPAIDTSARNLLPVLRESQGENRQEESLEPLGKVAARMPDGQRIEFDTSWYLYLGDMHIRLVFDGGQSLQSVSPEDLARLQLSPREALETGVANLRRMCSAPAVQPWSGGLMQVQGHCADLTSSYFLDRKFWQELHARYPEGLVAAVPRRGGLIYAPVSDETAVSSLRFGAAALYAAGAGSRLSSALYLFKDGRWSVFQPPQSRD